MPGLTDGRLGKIRRKKGRKEGKKEGRKKAGIANARPDLSVSVSLFVFLSAVLAAGVLPPQ